MIIPRPTPEGDGSSDELLPRMDAPLPAGASKPVPKKKEPKVKVPDAAKWLLTRDQKRALSAMAQVAWSYSGAAKSGERLDDYRHRIAMEACGRRVSEATQKDYNALKHAFKLHAGLKDAAFAAELHHGSDDANVARYKLEEELKRHGLNEAYAHAICQRKYKTSLKWASARQLWGILFDIRRSHTKKAVEKRDYAAMQREITQRRAAAEKAAEETNWNEPF